MKRPIEMTALLIAMVASATCAQAKHSDGSPEACFPSCEIVEPAKETQAPKDDAVLEAKPPLTASKTCGASAELAQDVEKLNAQIKPVKDLVGYVRSPQGLAVKLVNDHLFKIPGWVGFALDPVGTLKHKAIDEARGRAKEMLKSDDEACKPKAEMQPDLSIDAS